VDQGGRLQRLAGLLLGELLGGQLAQLLVDQRQQLLRGVRIAFLDGGQDAGYLTHGLCPEHGEAQHDGLARMPERLSEPQVPARV